MATTYNQMMGIYGAAVKKYEESLRRSYQKLALGVQSLQASLSTTREGGEEAETELREVVSLFAPEGAYGAGARARITEMQRTGTAAALAGLAKSGMYSGSLATGAQSRYAQIAEQALKDVEDTRFEQLAGAKTTLANAIASRYGQEAAIQTAIGSAYLTHQEPTEYAGLAQSAMGNVAQIGVEEARIASTEKMAAQEYSLAQQKMKLSETLQKSEQAFEAEQTAQKAKTAKSLAAKEYIGQMGS